jgi:hypothetical protein
LPVILRSAIAPSPSRAAYRRVARLDGARGRKRDGAMQHPSSFFATSRPAHARNFRFDLLRRPNGSALLRAAARQRPFLHNAASALASPGSAMRPHPDIGTINKEFSMTRSRSTLRFALAATLTTALSATAFAHAAGEAGDLAAKCSPPSSAAVCADWHRLLRNSFTPRELGMLFGAAAAYPEYQTSFWRVKDRYDRLRNEADLGHLQSVASN